MSEFKSRVLSTHLFGSTIRAIRVQKPSNLSFKASQAFMLSIKVNANGEHKFDGHPLSVSSAPFQPYLEFTVRDSNSAWKEAFKNLKSNDEVLIRGPGPHLAYHSDRPAVFLSAGVGVTPFKCIMEERVNTGVGDSIQLYLGSNNVDEIPWREDLNDLARNSKDIQVFYRLTQKPKDNNEEVNKFENVLSEYGYFDKAFISNLVEKNPKNTHYYICGPPKMVADLKSLLSSCSVSSSSISVELFRSAASYDRFDDMQLVKI